MSRCAGLVIGAARPAVAVFARRTFGIRADTSTKPEFEKGGVRWKTILKRVHYTVLTECANGSMDHCRKDRRCSESNTRSAVIYVCRAYLAGLYRIGRLK